MTESSFPLTFSSTNLRPRVAITPERTASGPTETFQVHSEPQPGRDAVARCVSYSPCRTSAFPNTEEGTRKMKDRKARVVLLSLK
jgi:hypothetical protein